MKVGSKFAKVAIIFVSVIFMVSGVSLIFLNSAKSTKSSVDSIASQLTPGMNLEKILRSADFVNEILSGKESQVTFKATESVFSIQKVRSGGVIVGNKVIKDPDLVKIIAENMDLIKKGRQMSLLIMPSPPRRATIKVDYNGDMEVTNVHDPYYWD